MGEDRWGVDRLPVVVGRILVPLLSLDEGPVGGVRVLWDGRLLKLVRPGGNDEETPTGSGKWTGTLAALLSGTIGITPGGRATGADVIAVVDDDDTMLASPLPSMPGSRGVTVNIGGFRESI